MQANIYIGTRKYSINYNKPIDISIAINGTDNLTAWYQKPPTIKAHKERGFPGSVEKGGAVNFNDIHFNPHAHGTHTECVGHITKDFFSVNEALKTFFFKAELITIAPEKKGDDWVISKKQLKYALGQKKPKALIIRTLPNTTEKLTKQYSHSNPPYLLEEAVQFMVKIGICHLLVDLPSVDKEKDNGALVAHKCFWQLNGDIRYNATITEFIYVPNSVVDGSYFLDLQMAAFENDAAPSRPILYAIEKEGKEKKLGSIFEEWIA